MVVPLLGRSNKSNRTSSLRTNHSWLLNAHVLPEVLPVGTTQFNRAPAQTNAIWVQLPVLQLQRWRVVALSTFLSKVCLDSWEFAKTQWSSDTSKNLCFDGSAVNHKCTNLGFVAFLFLFLAVRSPEGDLTLYCKGADTILYELLHSSCDSLKEETTEHLNVSASFCTTSLHLMVSFSPGIETYSVLRLKTYIRNST